MKKFLVLFLVVFLVFNFASAQKYYTPGQKKALARRAAVMDGYRQLAEAIYGVRVKSKTYVKDFVAESDEIESSLKQFIKGAQVVSERFLPDGTYEVDMVVNLYQLKYFLISANNRYGTGWSNNDFQNMGNYNSSIIKAKGVGAVPGGMSKKELERLKFENERLKKENQELKYKLQQMQGGYGYRSKYESLLVQFNSLKSQLSEMEMLISNYQSYKQKYDSLKLEFDNLKSQMSGFYGLKEEIARLEREKKEMQMKMMQYMNSYKQIEDLKKKNYYLNEQISKLQSTISELQAKLAEQQSKPKSQRSRLPVGVWNELPRWKRGRAKAMARRAAMMDGYRQLLESLKGIKIKSQTYVKDFVAESDEIEGAVKGFVKGAQVIDEGYLPDGTYEVEMEVLFYSFVNSLKETANQYNSGQWNQNSFNEMNNYYHKKSVKATGTGTFKQH